MSASCVVTGVKANSRMVKLAAPYTAQGDVVRPPPVLVPGSASVAFVVVTDTGADNLWFYPRPGCTKLVNKSGAAAHHVWARDIDPGQAGFSMASAAGRPAPAARTH